jgi:hypothetical protein
VLRWGSTALTMTRYNSALPPSSRVQLPRYGAVSWAGKRVWRASCMRPPDPSWEALGGAGCSSTRPLWPLCSWDDCARRDRYAGSLDGRNIPILVEGAREVSRIKARGCSRAFFLERSQHTVASQNRQTAEEIPTFTYGRTWIFPDSIGLPE